MPWSVLATSLTAKNKWRRCGRYCFFGAVSLWFLLFVYEISRGRWKDLSQTHTKDMFGPSLGRVWRRKSKVKVTRDKNGIFRSFRRPTCDLFRKTSLASSVQSYFGLDSRQSRRGHPQSKFLAAPVLERWAVLGSQRGGRKLPDEDDLCLCWHAWWPLADGSLPAQPCATEAPADELFISRRAADMMTFYRKQAPNGSHVVDASWRASGVCMDARVDVFVATCCQRCVVPFF